MLRQEVQKSPDIVDVEAKPVDETPTDESSESNGDININLAVETPVDNGTKEALANLESTVAELKKSLEESRKQEKKLQDKIVDLQADLKEQKEIAKKLQKDLEQRANIKAELEEVKKTALQLAETNSKLIEEADNSKKPQQSLKSLVPQETAKPVVYREEPKPIVPKKTTEKRFQTFSHQATSSSTSDLGYLD